jgi:hypothetical protein
MIERQSMLSFPEFVPRWRHLAPIALVVLVLVAGAPAKAVQYQIVYVPVTIVINGKPVVIRRPVVRPVAAPATFELNVSKLGMGTVQSNPAGIDCGADCTEKYAVGKVVTLSATPATGFRFDSWSGACTGAACTLTMNAAQNVTVTFIACPGGVCEVSAGNPGNVDVTFAINAASGPTHSISPLIYGTNGGRDIANNHQTLVRSGGNRLTAYNWENNASNAGSDWCFENDDLMSSSNSPAAGVTPLIDQALANGAAALITVPIVDYVAADKNHSQSCGEDVRTVANYLQTRFKQNKPAKGSTFAATPDQGDAFVYEDEFVNWLKTNRGKASILFSLDNEPDLWSSTHNEVHPNPVTYAELAQRMRDYASAIKNVWPSAKVIGPVSYGFYGYETLQSASDAAGRNFLDFYLGEAKAAETAAGKRLIDILDLHYYPEATGGGVRITQGDASAAVVAARVQAPRSLWDSSYVENSWITNDYLHAALQLIPRTQARINAKYPGTGLGFSEWNFGGGEHISGAVATADVLGIFGSQNVTLANLWELNGNESYTYAAFRAYRNFDGRGATFGDVSRAATSSDIATASVYASTFSSDARKTVIVAINKATTSKRAGIRVTSLNSAYTGAKVYIISATGGANVAAQPDISTVDVNAYNYTMPAMSVSIIVPY